MQRMLFIALSFTIGVQAFAGGVNPDKRASDVISLLKKNQPVEAFEKAFSGNELFKEKKSELDQLKYQFSGFVSQVGAPYDCELLVTRNLIERYRIDQYLCLSEMQPFVIQFDFYKPKKDWKIQAFSFNTDADDRIEESIMIEIGALSKPGK